MTTEDEILKVAPDPVRVARRLIVAAKLLYANAEGCAVNHYGEDFATHGLPGWLADCAVDIAAAEALGARALAAHLAAGAEPVSEPLYKRVEAILDEHSAWIARPNDEVTKRIALVAMFAAHSVLMEEEAPEDRYLRDGAREFATPPAPAVKVKALEWEDGPSLTRRAGEYIIEDQGSNWSEDRYFLFFGGLNASQRIGRFGTPEAAAAMANQHNEQRIRSALVEDAGVVIQNLTEMGDQSCLISTPITCSSKLQNSDASVSGEDPSSMHYRAPDLADLRSGAASPLADVASQERDTRGRPLSLSAVSSSSNEPLNSGSSTPAPASDDLADRLDAPTPFYGWKDPENYTPVMIPPAPLRTEASARIRSDAATIASLRAEVEKLRRVDQSCRWYWPEGATESENCSDCPQEVVQNVSGWGEPTGEVIAVARGGVVEVSYCAALPPASDADSDDEFWVQEPSIELAAAKIAAELERRAALAPIPAKEG